MAAVVVAATVTGTTALFGATTAQATTADAGTASAYGAYATLLGGNLLGPIPTVTLGAEGQSDFSQTLPADIPGLLTINTLNADVNSTGFGTAGEQIYGAAGAEGLTGLKGISLLNNPALLDVQAINVECNSNATGSTAATQIVGLSIGGAAPINIPSPIPPNTGLTAAELGPLAGLVTITLNKQSGADRPAVDGTDINVIGLQITLLGALDSGAVINVAQSSCAATGSDIESVPAVTSVTPNIGPVAGGTPVTIQGSGFVPTSKVEFGGVVAPAYAYHAAVTNAGVVTPAYMTATSPPATVTTSNSTVGVEVSDNYGYGPTPATAANDFTYEVTPSITTIAPTSGPTLGGQTVTLTGTNFGPDSEVYFGSSANVVAEAPVADTVVNAAGTQITVVTPAHTAGAVDVTVADVGGISVKANGYTYIPAPIDVTSVVPDVGPTTGTTPVVITGQGFTNASNTDTVKFGANNATSFTVESDTTIDAVAPAGAAGTVDVIVTNPSLNETPASLDSSFAVVGDHYTYEAAPVISASGLNPNTGPVGGGTSVTITGTGFGPDSTVAFGANPGTDVVVAANGDSLTVLSPASTLAGDHSGAVNVVVSDAGGNSNGELFTYIAPPIISANGIVPDAGPTAGGTAVVITGSNFVTTGITNVTFAGTQATDVDVKNATTIDAVSPAGDPGPASVVVTDAYGSSAPQNFTYELPPAVGQDGLNPAYGPTTGGTVVTITGTGLTGISSVYFGSTKCLATGDVGGTAGTAVSASSDTQATVTTPPMAAGVYAVCITATGGTAPAAEPFTYEGPITINASGLSPTAGPVAGGTEVTITGTGFGQADPNTTVTFGGAEAQEVAVESSTEILAITPQSPLTTNGGAGPVNVVVTDVGGTATAKQQFTYTLLPVISGISPTSGPLGGGETVTIKGSALCGATSVVFGPNNATINSASQDCTTLSVTEPAGTGTVPVFVTTPGGTAQSPENFTYIAPGYWEAASDGGVFAFGGARFFGSVPGVLKPGQALNSPIVAMADTADHGGYWLFAADGGVFCFGDAPFYGSIYNQLAYGQKLNAPIVTAEATPDGGGYRMFAADGGVFDFGDAVFEGSLPGEKIVPPAPINGAVAYPFGQGANPNNAGYWLVGTDGSIFTFGNAPNEGQATGQIFGKVVALATTPTGNGYYMFLQSGPVAAFGDAVKGLGGANSQTPIVFGQSTSTGQGYWEFAADGGVFSFGDAPFEGSLGGIHLNAPITAAIAFGSK